MTKHEYRNFKFKVNSVIVKCQKHAMKMEAIYERLKHGELTTMQRYRICWLRDKTSKLTDESKRLTTLSVEQQIKESSILSNYIGDYAELMGRFGKIQLRMLAANYKLLTFIQMDRELTQT